MPNQIYCYEPFASHTSFDNVYRAAVFKVWRNKFRLHWMLHEITFKTEEEALEVAQNYIDKVIYD